MRSWAYTIITCDPLERTRPIAIDTSHIISKNRKTNITRLPKNPKNCQICNNEKKQIYSEFGDKYCFHLQFFVR